MAALRPCWTLSRIRPSPPSLSWLRVSDSLRFRRRSSAFGSGRDYRAAPDARLAGALHRGIACASRRGAQTRFAGSSLERLSSEGQFSLFPKWVAVAERTGLEPATSAVTGQRSNQLNYRSTVMAATSELSFFNLPRLGSGILGAEAGARNKKYSGNPLLSPLL